jgi:hypothetical protein
MFLKKGLGNGFFYNENSEKNAQKMGIFSNLSRPQI